MSFFIIGLFIATIMCDVIMQLCFKYATTHHLTELPTGGDKINLVSNGLAFFRGLISSPLILGGLIIGIIDVVTWLIILEYVPLGFAYPIASLHYCGVVIGSKIFLGETISKRRWYGVIIITLGVAMVGVSGI